ncbi:low specificity L-threonine aldolase [Rhodococcus sp. BP-332]|uniref:threonine aldolase family protein n=1 Tax=Rhodococcus sp. BP-332 TaxID=2739447 RepID=UPI001C9AC5C7|nr:low specificity L-threonine aldolase [Rhodococcus sp. BP-332]MBY6679017.1 low specificity L-threonine aldolase [Rhodococcus sp. BP-332]
MATSTTAPLTGYLSDNAAGTAPEILAAMAEASTGLAAPYGNDPTSARLTTLMADVFERPVDVFVVGTGSAANGLALAACTPPWGSILTHPDGHITNDEAGAPEFFTDGAKIVLVDGPRSTMDPTALRAAVVRRRGDVHSVQPSVVSLTQVTETGSVHTLDEVREVSTIGHDAGLRVHMDGARFANALVALECTPAEMTWRAGVDILSFGATKNGTMTAEAIVSFDPSLSTELAFRHKRGGQLTSKMRFQSAQLVAYLENDLWMRHARNANAMAARLRDGLRQIGGIEVVGDASANMSYFRFPAALTQALHDRGFTFYDDRWEPGVVRLVTSFAHTARDVDAFVDAVRALAIID